MKQANHRHHINSYLIMKLVLTLFLTSIASTTATGIRGVGPQEDARLLKKPKGNAQVKDAATNDNDQGDDDDEDNDDIRYDSPCEVKNGLGLDTLELWGIDASQFNNPEPCGDNVASPNDRDDGFCFYLEELAIDHPNIFNVALCLSNAQCEDEFGPGSKCRFHNALSALLLCDESAENPFGGAKPLCDGDGGENIAKGQTGTTTAP